MGLARSLSLSHCAAGRGGLLRGQWMPCQPSAGPCPLGPLSASMPRQAAADGHFRLCDLWHNLGISPQVAQRRRVQCTLGPFTWIRDLAAVWSLFPLPCSGPLAGWGLSPSTRGAMWLEAPVSCAAVCLWPLVPCLLLDISGPSSATHPVAAACRLEHLHFLSLPFVTSTSFQWTD